jgi:starch synthase
MFDDLPGGATLRFQIQVPKTHYRALVARLRGEDARGFSSPSPTNQSEITALIDLLPDATTFSVTRLGHHRLPKAVSIRADSPTHQILLQSIFKELQNIKDPAVAARLNAIIKACPEDLPRSLRIKSDDFLITPTNHTSAEQEIRVLAQLAPTLMLDLDDTPTLTISSPQANLDCATRDLFYSALSESLKVQAAVANNTVTLTGSASLPALAENPEISLVAHWGGYDELAKPWQDEPLTLSIQDTSSDSTGNLTENFTENLTENLTFRATLYAPVHGAYGVAFYAVINNQSERIWIGRPQIDDCRFSITHDDQEGINSHYDQRRLVSDQAITKARTIVSDHDTPIESVEKFADWLDYTAPHLSLGALLYAEARASQSGLEKLQARITTLKESGQRALARRLQASFGVGELVFVTPEGPHAAAGGLAHVITGLPRELSQFGVPVTVIAPLYRFANGNKHRSAEEILRSGITVNSGVNNSQSETVIPNYATTISVELGPTHYTGTSFQKRPATTVRCKVYTAQSGRIRLILIADSAAFDRLYQPVYADEQLRRALLFSRAALETIATEALDIRPSALISNDWMTACVPSLLALDPRYQQVPWLRETKALHLIHNGGADYHGRLPLHFGNEDLWPLFNLAPEHYFGFSDPHQNDLINLTIAAAQHANGGVLTVSQPYARDLVSPTGGDGLARVLQGRRSAVFGISNGINRADINRYITARTGLEITDNDLSEPQRILKAKAAIRSDLQKRLRLTVDPEAKILSFVGRMAEQKGLDLLSGIVDHAAHSTLEDILIRHRSTQIIIAGPLTAGDRSATALHDAARYLESRYPGRVSASFDYISHSSALEIMAASTLFLMPSRFEPGGITQLEALAVGTAVVGRNVGGIGATVTNYDPDTGRGTGFLCNDYTPTAFADTIHWALAICADNARYQRVVEQALTARHSWADRAPTFLAVLQRVILEDRGYEGLSFVEDLAELVQGARAW